VSIIVTPVSLRAQYGKGLFEILNEIHGGFLALSLLSRLAGKGFSISNPRKGKTGKHDAQKC